MMMEVWATTDDGGVNQEVWVTSDDGGVGHY